MTKLHELTGQILGKEQKKVYDKNSPYYGNIHYRLKISAEQEIFLFAYCNLVSKAIFQTIEQSQYVGKRYHFIYTKRKGGGCILQN
jgi:hypothetical protein